MITISTRPYTPEEKKYLHPKVSLYQRMEKFVVKYLFVFFPLVLLGILFDKFHPLAPHEELGMVIGVVVISFPITIWVTRYFRKQYEPHSPNPENGLAEVIRVKTSRAVKREDAKDFGIAFYLDVTDNGKQKTLFLWGQYLDDLEYENKFPNTEFEIIRSSDTKSILDIKLFGRPFAPEKVLPPFEKSVFKLGDYPADGQVLELTIDQIVE